MWYWIAYLSLYDSSESLWLMRKFCSHETELLTWAYMIFWASWTHEPILITWDRIAHLSLYDSPEPLWLMSQSCSSETESLTWAYMTLLNLHDSWGSIAHKTERLIWACTTHLSQYCLPEPVSLTLFTNNLFIIQWVQQYSGGLHDHDCMVTEFTTTYAICAYHH